MLAMINVAAVCSVRNWPITAEYGFSSLFFFVCAALLFIIPVSLVSAELATAWPKTGGIYIWVKEAFGQKWAFLAVWLLWLENVIWYPTVLSFVGGAIAYAIYPNLANHPYYLVTVISVVFWGATLINLLGMRISGWVSTLGVILGTVIPAALIITLGALWYFSGKPLQITLSYASLIPDMSQVSQLVLFSSVLLSFSGLEMSAIHAGSVDHPKKNYPKAIFLSALFILALSVLGVLAIAFVIPQKEISLTAGSLQAFAYFLSAYNLNWMLPYVAILIALGALGSISTWIAGPSKGLMIAAQSGDLPPAFSKVNRHGMPTLLLITQAILITFLSLLFIFMPSFNSAYFLLSTLAIELYLLMYILMFAAAIYLRYKKPNVDRPYKIPCGNTGMWIVSGIGLLACFGTFMIGFVPPAQIHIGSPTFYISFLIIGTLLSCLIPTLIKK